MVAERRIVSLVAIAFVAIAAAMRWPALEMIQFVLLVAILAHSSDCDLRSRVIPNVDIAAAVLVRLAYFAVLAAFGNFAVRDFANSLLGGFALGLLLLVLVLVIEYVTGRSGMGGGDLKLYAVAGLYVGFEKGVLVVLASCILGLVAGLAMPIEDQENKDNGESNFAANRLQRKMPFGPLIALSLAGVMLAVPTAG